MTESPTDWKKYQATLTRPERRANSDFNKFAARYRLAASLSSVDFEGFTQGTKDGYAAALRVGLAYSALETLERAIEKRTRPIHAPKELSAILRSKEFKPLFELLNEELDSTKLKDAVAAFRRRKHSDLRPIASGIRHLMFHGRFTPHGAGIATSKKRISAVESIAIEVLNFADSEFSKWFNGTSSH